MPKRLILILLTLSTIFFLYQSSKLNFNNEKWLPANNPHQKEKEYLHTEFETGEALLIAIELKESYYTPQTITNLKLISYELKEIPNVLKLKSPLHATLIHSNNNELIIETYKDALEKGHFKTLADYRKKLRSSHYQDRLISHDDTLIAILLTIDINPNATNHKVRKQVIRDVQRTLNKYPHFKTHHITGDVALIHQMDSKTKTNLGKLLALASIAMLITMAIIFREKRRLLLTLSTTLVGLIICLGSIAAMNHPLSIVNITLPILIIVISISTTIHIITRYNLLKETGLETRSKKAIRQTWLPCALTSLTTAIGFGSFMTSNLLPLRRFGIESLLIICLTFIIILPTIALGLRKIKPVKENLKKEKIFKEISSWTLRNKTRILQATALTSLMFIISLNWLHTETNFIDVFFKKSSKIHQDFDFVDKHLGGTGGIDIILKPKEEESFKTIQKLQLTESLNHQFQNTSHIQHVQSYTTPVSMIHKEFSKDKSKLPRTPDELEQELLFLEFSRNAEDTDVLSPYIDFTYTNTRIHLQTKNLSSKESIQLINSIETELKKKKTPYSLTGNNYLFHIMNTYVLSTQIGSIILTFLIIWVIFIIKFGIKYATIGIIPNLLPIIITTGTMAISKTPLDTSTVLIASIGLGLSVDDTIHYLHNYLELKKEKVALKERIQETTHLVGTAMFKTSLLLIIGCAIFLLSDLVLLIKFGLFTTLTIIAAYIADILVLPALLLSIDKK